MIKTSIFEYYAFGFNYGLLKQSGLRNYGRTEALEELDEFFGKLKELHLRVTLNVAKGLKEVAEGLRESEEDSISPQTADRVLQEIAKIDPALDAELQLRESYVLTEKKYSLDKLTEEPNKLLAHAVYSELDETTRKDFGLACMQVALNQPTAAAFHLMRALEAEVRLLYMSYKKTKRLKVLLWKPMVEQLRAKRNPKPSEKLLTHLDGIREHFRNPTQHPDAFYTLDEAEDLLNQTISSINMIHAELKSAKNF